MKYLRFALILLVSTPVMLACNLAGGYWPLMGVVIISAFMVAGDGLGRTDETTPAYARTWMLNAVLILQVPAALTFLFLLAWFAAPGDWLGFGAAVEQISGWHLRAIHAGNDPLELIALALATGYFLSTNTVVAHELVHRTDSAASVITGRWLLAMIGDTQFSISHIYAHHPHVGTDRDSATARRGESVYHFAWRSAAGQILESVAIERQRLQRKGNSFWSMNNRFLTGLGMTMAIMAVFYGIAGPVGVGLFAVSALYAKFLFETVNYIQHYGLLRAVGERVQPRHSWDCAAPVSGGLLFNLTRHSAHHARANLPFWELQTIVLAPKMPYGYMTMILAALIPPFWFRLMDARLNQWYTGMASHAEREIAKSKWGKA